MKYDKNKQNVKEKEIKVLNSNHKPHCYQSTLLPLHHTFLSS